MRFVLAIIMSTFALSSFAGSYIGSLETKINAVISYSEFGDGDVIFTIENPIPECSHGYWLKKVDPGFQANLSMVIAAYQAKNPVVIYGIPEEIWPGSSGKACHLYNIKYK